MKKAVITILGTIGGRFDQNKKEFVFVESTNKSLYQSKIDSIEKYLKKKSLYVNTLPMLIDLYEKEYEIIPIYTKEAQKIQKKVLEKLECKKEYVSLLDTGIEIEDENNFNDIFSKIDKVINSSEYEKIIIDVTHGFRHLPLLMLIDIIMVNFNNNDKIEKILFAKELVKPIAENNFTGKYEVIDLKDYLDLANLNYVLTSFERNYTTAKIKTNNEQYNKLLDLLENFSAHILANSLDALILNTDIEKSIANKIINEINNILNTNDDVLNYFSNNLQSLKKHIEIIQNFNNEIDYKKYFKFAKNMRDKGYLLNSITLLSETIGLYCKEELKKIDNQVKNYIENYEQKLKKEKNSEDGYFKLYTLSNHSKYIYKLGNDFKGKYLDVKCGRNEECKERYRKHNNRAREIANIIRNYINGLVNNEDYKSIQNLIDNIDNLRNNLAHGNSSLRLQDVENEIDKLLIAFEEIII